MDPNTGGLSGLGKIKAQAASPAMVKNTVNSMVSRFVEADYTLISGLVGILRHTSFGRVGWA